jgi:hypothetical protein
MSRLDDTARFAAEDDGAIVAAALVCPYCLSRPAQALVTEDRAGGGSAICACASCRIQWSIALDSGQVARLFLNPPPGLWILHHAALQEETSGWQRPDRHRSDA